jgi:tripartite-type tricarboxylate transporter receptor subunit TctC
MHGTVARRRLVRVVLIALSCLALPGEGFAAEFASQVIKIVVPFAAGGGTDIISRTLAQEMEKQLGGTVIIENKPGAGTIVGSEYVAKAAPDGHTLIMATFAHAVNPSLRAKLPFDPDKDFTPVALVARSFNIVVVNPGSGINSIADLVAAAKAKPNGLNYGTFGPGTSAHLAGELFKSLTHVKMTAVHYKGAAPAITDLLGGTIQVMFTTVASATSLIKAGKLKALAVTSAKRTAAFSDLPTVAEAGVSGYAGKDAPRDDRAAQQGGRQIFACAVLQQAGRERGPHHGRRGAGCARALRAGTGSALAQGRARGRHQDRIGGRRTK